MSTVRVHDSRHSLVRSLRLFPNCIRKQLLLHWPEKVVGLQFTLSCNRNQRLSYRVNMAGAKSTGLLGPGRNRRDCSAKQAMASEGRHLRIVGLKGASKLVDKQPREGVTSLRPGSLMGSCSGGRAIFAGCSTASWARGWRS